jgi:hypothetical protein
MCHILLLQISRDFCKLGESGLEVFDDFGGNDIGIRQVGAVFEALKARPLLHPRYGIFEPDLNSLGAKNETDRAVRPTSWEARSQDVDDSLTQDRS